MDKEEKEVKKVTKKTTTNKKTPVKKNETVKKETKTTTKKTSNTTKVTETKKETSKKQTKPAQKKETTKKVSSTTKASVAKSKPIKNETEKKSDKSKSTAKPKTIKKEVKQEVVKEVPQVEATTKKEIIKEQKVVTKNVPVKKVSTELLKIRQKRYIIEAIVIAVVAIIALLFLCNRTFLKTTYKTDSVDISIPRFSYYKQDKDNKLKLTTLRKSDYLKEYYNEYLEGFIFYSCAEGNNTFYYNEETQTLIKEIKVEKRFIVKTIEITYDTRTPEEICGLR